MEKLATRLKSAFKRFASIRGNPGEIAMGFSIGVFVGMSPYFLFHTVTAIFLASIFKCNKISAAAGVFITNPLTAPFFYQITWLVGSAFMRHDSGFQIPSELNIQSALQILKQTPEVLWILTIGGIITGLPAAVAGYYLSLWCIMRYRKGHLVRDQAPDH